MFSTSMVGPSQNAKKMQNDRQIRGHVEKWIMYMWASPGDINKSLLFLGDVSKLVA